MGAVTKTQNSLIMAPFDATVSQCSLLVECACNSKDVIHDFHSNTQVLTRVSIMFRTFPPSPSVKIGERRAKCLSQCFKFSLRPNVLQCVSKTSAIFSAVTPESIVGFS